MANATPAPAGGVGASPNSGTPSPNVAPRLNVNLNAEVDEYLRTKVKKLLAKIIEHVKVIEKCRKEDREKWQEFNKKIEELEALRAERMKIRKYKRMERKEKEKKAESEQKSENSKSGQPAAKQSVKKTEKKSQKQASVQKTQVSKMDQPGTKSSVASGKGASSLNPKSIVETQKSVTKTLQDI